MLKSFKKLFGGKTKKKTAAKPAKKSSPKKKIAKKPARVSKRSLPVVTPSAKPIGRVTHFYGGIKVAIVKFKQDVRKGTKVRFQGATTDFVQALDSMQYDHKAVAKAPKAKLIGIKVKKRVRDGDEVFLER